VTALAAISLGMLGVLAGLMIGVVGIGGVVLVPALVYFGGIPIHVAIAAAMMSYLLAGLIGTLVYAREKSFRWGMACWLCAGAMPAALAGALAAGRASSLLLEVLIGLLTAASGAHALLASPAGYDAHSNAISSPALGFIGAVTGFGSALSGTGGPLILVPILIWLDVPVLTAIGLSQAIQLPIALLATAGNFFPATSIQHWACCWPPGWRSGLSWARKLPTLCRARRCVVRSRWSWSSSAPRLPST
jgi:uncharacterized protein